MTDFAAWLDAREPALRRAVHALTGDAVRTRTLVRDGSGRGVDERPHRWRGARGSGPGDDRVRTPADPRRSATSP